MIVVYLDYDIHITDVSGASSGDDFDVEYPHGYQEQRIGVDKDWHIHHTCSMFYSIFAHSMEV